MQMPSQDSAGGQCGSGNGRDGPCQGLQPTRAASSTTPPSAGFPHRSDAITSEQAAQLIDNTLDLVHQRLLDLESQSLDHEHKALAAEFREWRQPVGGHIDLMVFPGLAES